jgi:hypothetical protein
MPDSPPRTTLRDDAAPTRRRMRPRVVSELSLAGMAKWSSD